MTITYIYGGSLYVNITNRCPNACDFCVRTHNDGFYSEDSLWLDCEPTRQEILDDILRHDLAAFDELVFCGYGEPTCRLDDMLWVCRAVRRVSNIRIRLNTNGQANLICGRDTAPDFEGALDIVSISLNAADAAGYQALCHSEYGEAAYASLLDFAAEVKRYVPEVMLTVVRTTIPDEEIDRCRGIAAGVGVSLRVRELV